MKVLVLAGAGALSLTLPISLVIVAAAGHRRALLPPDDPRLSLRRRQLHRRQRQPRRAAWPHRRRRAADRLRADRLGLGRRGRAALTSLVPALLPYTVPLAVGAVVLITMANLRGIRESGTIFADPDLRLRRR